MNRNGVLLRITGITMLFMAIIPIDGQHIIFNTYYVEKCLLNITVGKIINFPIHVISSIESAGSLLLFLNFTVF